MSSLTIVGDGCEQVDAVIAKDGLLSSKLGLELEHFFGELPKGSECIERSIRAIESFENERDDGENDARYLEACHCIQSTKTYETSPNLAFNDIRATIRTTRTFLDKAARAKFNCRQAA